MSTWLRSHKAFCCEKYCWKVRRILGSSSANLWSSEILSLMVCQEFFFTKKTIKGDGSAATFIYTSIWRCDLLQLAVTSLPVYITLTHGYYSTCTNIIINWHLVGPSILNYWLATWTDIPKITIPQKGSKNCM